MQPLHELLDRIKWDPEFAKGEFALGYYDHVAHIPLHRVRTVYKDGLVIWQRPGHPAGE